MNEGTETMRCFKILNGHISGPPVELIATIDAEAIAEAKGIAATRDWAEFEVWDLDRAVFKHAGHLPI